ncbi:putative transcription factor GRAS family [Helianthus annuus]|nr:putative transcription factor GRAS family [Helianthus annuus]KAJ0915593.1 putative transcription factor GRAS family [Helianthus annuus]
MVMESSFHEYTDFINGFSLDDENTSPVFDQYPGHVNGYRFRDEPLDLSFLDVPSPSPIPAHDPASANLLPVASHVDSPDEYTDYVAKFINQILVEENMESKQSMFLDPFALQDTEKSFYEALGNNQLSVQPPFSFESLEEIPGGSTSEYSTHSSTSGSNSVQPQCLRSDSFETKSSVTQTHLRENLPFESTISVTNDVNDTMDSMINAHVFQNMFTNNETMLQFKKGMEEARKFLPPNKPLVIDLEKYNLPSDIVASPPDVVKTEKVEMDNLSNRFRGRKHFQLEDNSYEDERISKQSAVYEDEEDELSQMFDKILLCTNAKGEPTPGCGDLPKNPNLQYVYSGWNAPVWRTGNANESIDIRTLLINCAQSVAADDYKVASEQLKQIRQHASPSGNASQRLAHIFALGLEARMSGTGSEIYESQKTTGILSADKLKALQSYMSSCPFKKNEIFFANKTIYEAALSSSTLHIVDFGIAYGFQWPILIKHLGDRPGGPPKLRITGIEFPQPGFRPAEWVEETGRRLATYCERFKVPFEYNAIAIQNWEMINIDDLKLQRNEFLAVNALARFENLLDETMVTGSSPRDAVLKLVRDMKPDIFVHSIVNGSYSAPFFVTRFREALFHYSALFDMLDATIERENEQRQSYEGEFHGRQVMNVIACEGPQRVERPETYKQWQVRITRAGFKPRRIDRELVSQVKSKVKAGYHKDYVFDEDGKWMLQGWKGRILYAITCWVPV